MSDDSPALQALSVGDFADLFAPVHDPGKTIEVAGWTFERREHVDTAEDAEHIRQWHVYHDGEYLGFLNFEALASARDARDELAAMVESR